MSHSNENASFLPLFKAVGCVCIFEKKILLLKRVNDKSYPQYWGIPSGKIDENESDIKAMIRELFEETHILLSSENLSLLKTYHINSDEMNFLYTLYFHNFELEPVVKIKNDEHQEFGWFSLEKALKLKLIPELDTCLKDVFDREKENLQFDLFPDFIKSKYKPSLSTLEQNVKFDGFSLKAFENSNKIWYVSYGPPGAGKTTALKGMASRNSDWKFVEDKSFLVKNTLPNFYLQKIFTENDHSFYMLFQICALPIRFRQVINSPSRSLVDETIFSIFAYSRALYRLSYIDEHQYQSFYHLYLSYLCILPPPKSILYFDCKFETLSRRIKARGRKHENFYSDDYIRTLKEEFANVANILALEYKIVSINTDNLKAKDIVNKYEPLLFNDVENNH